VNPTGRRSRGLHVSIPYSGENPHFVEKEEEQCTAHLDFEDAIDHTELVGNGPVCTENLIRVDDVMESPKLAE
jgi:hypothetical protein